MTRDLVLARHADFILVNKPAGVLTAPGRDPLVTTTIQTLVRDVLGLDALPRLCHRLDRDTSGVMLLALTKDAQRDASQAFERHLVRKTYVALVTGTLEGVRRVDHALGEDPDAPRDARSRQAATPDGKPARTLLRALWTDGNVTLVGARPSTGRTHQVRVHLALEGHPLLGDALYGGPQGPRVMLHAAYLALRAGSVDLAQGAALPTDFSTLTAVELPAPEEVDRLLTAAARGIP